MLVLLACKPDRPPPPAASPPPDRTPARPIDAATPQRSSARNTAVRAEARHVQPLRRAVSARLAVPPDRDNLVIVDVADIDRAHPTRGDNQIEWIVVREVHLARA